MRVKLLNAFMLQLNTIIQRPASVQPCLNLFYTVIY